MEEKKELVVSLLQEKAIIQSRLKAINSLLSIYVDGFSEADNPSKDIPVKKELPPLKYKEGTTIKFIAENNPVITRFTLGRTYKVRNRIEKDSHLYLKYGIKGDNGKISYFDENSIDKNFEVVETKN